MRLWIDTDLALGASRGDIDDGFALAAVLRALHDTPQDISLLGISCVGGNAPPDQVLHATRSLLGHYPPETVANVPILAQTEAADALSALGDDVTVLALGPPTNLVAAASLDPDFPSRVEVRAVGTLLQDGWNPLFSRFCLNFRRDPEASKAFFRLPWKRRVLYPIDVLWSLRFGARDLDRIAAQGPIGRYLAAGSRRWLRQAPWRYLRRSFPVWDLVAALDTVGRLPGARHKRVGGGDRHRILTSFDRPATLRACASFEVPT